MSVPALVPERVAARALTAEVEVLEPVAVAACLTLFLNVNKLRELSADVVENSVEYNSYAVLVEAVADKAERVVIAESAVYLLVVNSVIAVLYRLENRSEVNSVDVHFLEMGYPFKHLVKAVYNIIAEIVEFRSSAEAERINMIDYRVIVPVHVFSPL